MTLIEFERLPTKEKIDLLHREGIYVGKRKVDTAISVLYQCDSFYVEIFYRKYRRQIESIRCFTSPDAIDPYLDQNF